MKCKLISLLTVLILLTHISQGQNNITVSLDVEKIPELGFVISSQRSEMTSMEFSANGHAKYQLENTDAVYLTLHNGFSERKMIYAEQGDHIQLSFDGASMAKTLKMKGVRQSIADYLLRKSKPRKVGKPRLCIGTTSIFFPIKRQSNIESTFVRQLPKLVIKGKQ